MFFQNITAGQAVLGFWILVGLLGLWRLRTIVVAKRKALEANQKAREDYNTEAVRIYELPKLNTQWLMRAPNYIIGDNPTLRSFGTRYNRMLIIDEFGYGWVGLVTPEILEDLKAGEYVWRNYWIPFRGGGEAITGNPVTINGVRIDIYPKWMAEGTHTADLNIWAQIEKNFQHRSTGWNYQSGLGEMNRHMEEFQKKRAEFNTLARAAKMDTKVD